MAPMIQMRIRRVDPKKATIRRTIRARTKVQLTRKRRRKTKENQEAIPNMARMMRGFIML